ncbi:MAG: GNAT family N-acetyltransferase [Chloroflexota bacterium]
MTVTLRPVSAVSFHDLTAAYNAAYSDYIIPIYATTSSITRLRDHVAVDFEASQVAVVGNRIVGFGFLGVRGQRGWISSIAVLPDYRRQGIGRIIMDGLTRTARGRGLTRLQLEVGAHNTPALALYDQLGYQRQGELLTVGLDERPDFAETGPVHTSYADRVLSTYERTHPIMPPWQREKASLLAVAWDRVAWYVGADVSAYIIGYTWDGVISFDDVGFQPGEEAAFRALLAGLFDLYPEIICRMSSINAAEPAWAIMAEAGFEVVMTEYQMTFALDQSVPRSPTSAAGS